MPDYLREVFYMARLSRGNGLYGQIISGNWIIKPDYLKEVDYKARLSRGCGL